MRNEDVIFMIMSKSYLCSCTCVEPALVCDPLNILCVPLRGFFATTLTVAYEDSFDELRTHLNFEYIDTCCIYSL